MTKVVIASAARNGRSSFSGSFRKHALPTLILRCRSPGKDRHTRRVDIDPFRGERKLYLGQVLTASPGAKPLHAKHISTRGLAHTRARPWSINKCAVSGLARRLAAGGQHIQLGADC